ncbi:hypothetical protein MMALV_12820 [Candidatus Methanomethylophilus alvi Mx1201]|uniref:Uncharacterized protein n=1 Tax=Methanomethylophilus alvi (strain Mx1201) TaxID=1236689 RepID=M9SIT2_METAX|nr:hypothetical protein MMALV_12820 [Candidatus Methanomethylophilus alvi Mx1201]
MALFLKILFQNISMQGLPGGCWGYGYSQTWRCVKNVPGCGKMRIVLISNTR